MSPPVADSTRTEDKKTSPRRINKPLIEKRRRARINDCLTQLKAIVLEATDTQSPRPSKLEKADILEMTVDFIKKKTSATKDIKEPQDEAPKMDYMAGYGRCLAEISQFLEKTKNEKSSLKMDILTHISRKMKEKHDDLPQTMEIESKHEETTPAAKTEPKSPVTCTGQPARQVEFVAQPDVNVSQQPVTVPTTSTSNQNTSPLGLLCGGQVLLLVQLPTSQNVMTSQNLMTSQSVGLPAGNVAPAVSTSSGLSFVSPAVPQLNLGNGISSLPSYIRDLNLAGPANLTLSSVTNSSSSSHKTDETSGTPCLRLAPHPGTVPNAIEINPLQQVGNQSAPRTSPLSLKAGDVGNQDNTESPWRPW